MPSDTVLNLTYSQLLQRWEYVNQIILSQWDDYILGITKQRHEWLSLVVDDTRERGGKLGVGKQTVLLSFEWESLDWKE